jgi:tripartite-type tricarboxylate transporter receptor subunit TctC
MKNVLKFISMLGLLVACGVASAQFPSKPIRIVVPYQAGNALEPIVRTLADEMTATLKQPVVIEYKPGGATTIGAAYVAQAPADGHTIFVNASSFLISGQLMAKLPYDPKKAFVSVSGLGSFPHVLIAPANAPYKTAKEFLEYARKNGDSMNYGSFGNASSGHVGFERLKKEYGFKSTHVPYKGNEGIQDIIAGRLNAMFNDLPVVVPFANEGKLQALAIATEQRDPTAPGIPTFEEATGKQFLSRSWFGLLVRSETPPEIVRMLNQAVVTALNKPQVVARLQPLGVQLMPTTPRQFDEFMAQQNQRFAEAIEFANIRMD